MEINHQQAAEFAQLLIMRGLGLYGDKKMAKICDDSGMDCRAGSSYELPDNENIEDSLKKLMINYSKFNLPAKMTVLVLAKKYGMLIPEELKSSKKKKSKYRQKLEFKS